MNYFMAHTFFIIMVVFGIVAVTAFLVCVIKFALVRKSATVSVTKFDNDGNYPNFVGI